MSRFRKTGLLSMSVFMMVSLVFGYVAPAAAQTNQQGNISNIKNELNKNATQANLVTYSGVEGSLRAYLCVPIEGDNGTGLYDCVQKLYRFGVVVGALLLVFFVVLAGYMYITGSEGGKKNAKDLLFSALTGVGVILFSYLLLSFINPNLVRFKPIQPPIFRAADLPSCEDIGYKTDCLLPGGQVYNGSSVSGNGDVTAQGYVPANDQCGGDPSKLCKATYPNNRCTKEVVSRCATSEYDGYFNQGLALYKQKGGSDISGLDMKTLVKAIATVERGCTKTGATSGAGAAGMMQFIQGSAKLFAPKCGAQVGSWPSWANDNPAIQVCMAAFHLKENEKNCGTQVRNIAAGYNAGPGRCSRDANAGCKVSSCDGTSPLRDWECKCGWYAQETADYGPNVSGCYYNAFK